MNKLIKSTAFVLIASGLIYSIQAGAGLNDEGKKCGGKAKVGDTWDINVYGSQGRCKVKTLAILSGGGSLMSGPECGTIVDIPHITGPCGEWSKDRDKDE
jgi:hypothetical protein